MQLCSNKFIINNNFFFSHNYYFDKFFVKKKLILNKSKVGIIKNLKKSSLIRNKNYSFFNQYFNIVQKKGKKNNIYKNVCHSLENLQYILLNYSDDFKYYKNYNNFVVNYNINYLSSIEHILKNSLAGLESIFEIKTKKNNKKTKLTGKYSYEIVYIKKEKRLKYLIRSLSFYKNTFKNYVIWERIFWSFFLTIVNKNNLSFLNKRRDYIYIKSIKFFKKKKTK